MEVELKDQKTLKKLEYIKIETGARNLEDVVKDLIRNEWRRIFAS